MKLLTVDIGNSKIKTGLFENQELNEVKIFNEPDEFIDLYKDIKFDACAVASVVPEKSQKLKDILKNNFSCDTLIISKDVLFNLKIDYLTPETLGIDRICSAEGAYLLFSKEKSFKKFSKNDFILSVDFGTATTINVVKYKRKFTGGIIAPGISLMSEALNKNTAQLPAVNFNDYKNFIGKTTKESISSGVVNSTVGLIEKMIRNLKNEYGAKKIKVYITGGNAEFIKNFLSFKFVHEPSLVLWGIMSVFEKNKKVKQI